MGPPMRNCASELSGGREQSSASCFDAGQIQQPGSTLPSAHGAVRLDTHPVYCHAGPNGWRGLHCAAQPVGRLGLNPRVACFGQYPEYETAITNKKGALSRAFSK